jgi:hypothetical protein
MLNLVVRKVTARLQKLKGTSTHFCEHLVGSAQTSIYSSHPLISAKSERTRTFAKARRKVAAALRIKILTQEEAQ